MVPDSNIAKKYDLGPNKLCYSVNFGLAPYFKSILMEGIRKSAQSESLNNLITWAIPGIQICITVLLA